MWNRINSQKPTEPWNPEFPQSQQKRECYSASFFWKLFFHLYGGFAKIQKLFGSGRSKVLMNLFFETYAHIVLSGILNEIGGHRISRMQAGVLLTKVFNKLLSIPAKLKLKQTPKPLRITVIRIWFAFFIFLFNSNTFFQKDTQQLNAESFQRPQFWCQLSYLYSKEHFCITTKLHKFFSGCFRKQHQKERILTLLISTETF